MRKGGSIAPALTLFRKDSVLCQHAFVAGSEASAHRLSERCFVISTAVAGTGIVIPLARLRHVNVLALRLVGNRRRLRLIAP